MLLSKCTMCHNKKLRLNEEQEVSSLFNSLRINTPLSKIFLLGPYLIYKY